jgi:hypothetical protein
MSRLLADQALTRAAGSSLVPGNAVRLLKDAAENYPAWLLAIRGALDEVRAYSAAPPFGASAGALMACRAR